MWLREREVTRDVLGSASSRYRGYPLTETNGLLSLLYFTWPDERYILLHALTLIMKHRGDSFVLIENNDLWQAHSERTLAYGKISFSDKIGFHTVIVSSLRICRLGCRLPTCTHCLLKGTLIPSTSCVLNRFQPVRIDYASLLLAPMLLWMLNI